VEARVAAERILSPTEFLRAVRKGKRFDCLLLRGEEEFLLRQALDEYVNAAIPIESRDLDFSEFRVSEIDAKSLWNALITMPFLSERRVIVLDLSGEPKDEIAKCLATYTARPSASTSLIMVAIVESLKNTRASGMPDTVTEVQFASLNERQRGDWALDYAKNLGKGLNEDAVRYLIQTSSRNLLDLSSKLDQAALYVGGEKEITVQALMRVSGVSSEFTVFQLEDALLGLKPEEAHKIARSLLEGGEPLLRILAFHRTTVTRLWQAARVANKKADWQGTGEGKAWKASWGRKDFKIKDFTDAGRALGEPRMRAAVAGLLKVEVWAKSRSDDPYKYFEWLWKFRAD
jgi:DNA polymerase III subunit delta